MLRAALLFPTLCLAGREVENLDQGWRFVHEEQQLRRCNSQTFPSALRGRCPSLAPQGRPEDGAPGSAAACRDACCDDSSCNAWQWCGDNAGCESPNTCFKGLIDIQRDCSGHGEWEGQGDPSREPEPEPRPGHPCNFQQCLRDFNDSTWTQIDVPHDFVVAGNFTPRADKSHGYLPYGVAWYRRQLCLQEAAEIMEGSRQSWLEFEGVMVKSKVWLNGAFLGSHSSGYTPQILDISPAPLESGCSNVLAVLVDATAPDGWWYDGGGIYRHVWRTTTSPVHVVPWGLYAPAKVVGAQSVDYGDAEVYPIVELVNKFQDQKAIRIACSIRSLDGQLITHQDLRSVLAPGETVEFPLKTMYLKGARLWSPGSPSLYEMIVEIWSTDSGNEGPPDDQIKTTFGVRNLSWSPDIGFSINGVVTKILGTANHQDFAVLGVAVPDHLQEHRLKKLQQFGANAWRTAHNPPNEALLNAADRLGVLVWDENHRNGQDEEMEVMIKRDRNHPSIVIWSICNERLCDTIDVRGDAERLKALAHRLDPHMGRVVSANYNNFNGNRTPMDLMGFDYGPEMYDKWHAEAPQAPAISSETSSAYSDRGLVWNNRTAGHVRDYDTEHPSWGQTAEVAWQAILSRPFVGGGFTWTGWDYRGEPTPYSWPDVNSHFGILDIAGFWKHRAHWYHACWTAPSDGYVLHLLPHWNWEPGHGSVDVWAYSNLEELELIHPNGTSLGRRQAPQCSRAEWQVPYMKGSLTALGYLGGRKVKTTVVSTTGSPSALRMEIMDGIGAEGVRANGQDVGLISVEVVDDQGAVVPTSSEMIHVSATSGIVLGTANGDPSSLEPNFSPRRSAFGGRLLAVVRPEPRGLGRTMTVRAESPNLTPAELRLKVLGLNSAPEHSDMAVFV
ncbi:Beta-galactosidase BoGH2A (Beta-gal) (Glycosyl hydrolase family protein 2A) (BoGH2A) [Durusdinium trenchii]|uniref:Beta-galactosidase BoGH2A (Beta-gal) (Glycosyl hydrolase family protein 2A) (BoGH2A) n=1 Tax=Durusdinium trenchii TaxID=1381693 RepID=A0ABP0LXR1_9DINO